MQADTFLASNRKIIIEGATKYQLPVIYPFDFFTEAGGLISYGPNVLEQFRQSASYISRILNGERPGDLPVQQPTKFELVLNVKTAKALGPQRAADLLATADKVIE